MIKAIVFDCYGVLVGGGFDATYRAAGGDPVADAAFIGGMLGLANSGQISRAEFAARIAGQLGLTVAEWQAVAARSELPDEALFAFIKSRLRPRYKLAVLSNANSGSLQRRIPADKLALFDEVIVSAEVGLMKPQPEIFQLAAKRLGVALDEMIFTDDLPEYTDAAARLGIHAILYQGQSSLQKKLSELLDGPAAQF